MIILYVIISATFIAIALGVIVVRRNKKLIADAVKAEAEHKEWNTKRRASMTQEQRDSEDFYYSQLRAMPVWESWKPRGNNNLSKDLLGFELLPK